MKGALLNATLAVALMMTRAVAAQTAPPTAAEPLASSAPVVAPDPPPQSPVDVEVFKGPQQKRVDPARYPFRERASGQDGWVTLNFMIDTQGKPYEIMVVDSTGSEGLEKAAIEAATKWEFEPATLGGLPIDAGYAINVKFRLTGRAGANQNFITAYKDFVRAIASQDRPKADEAMARMKVQNLYEDAYFGLAQFEYERRWGSERQQIVALKRAITASEDGADYLPKELLRAALSNLLNLQIKSNDFGGALETWAKLRKAADAETLAGWEKRIQRIIELRTDARPYAVAGEFDDSSSWWFRLFRNQFEIRVSNGRVSEIKLRCDKKYVFFKYDPDLRYTISDKYGLCAMELVGDPGTKFTLIQS